jgi:hypothetical protein
MSELHFTGRHDLVASIAAIESQDRAEWAALPIHEQQATWDRYDALHTTLSFTAFGLAEGA